MSDNIILMVPKRITVNFLPTIIRVLNQVKVYKNKRQSNFFLDFRNYEEVDLLGVLLLYKYMDYTVVNNCFYNPSLHMFNPVSISVKKYGFSEIISRCFSDERKAIEAFSRLRSEIKDNFILAPIAISEGYSEDLEKQVYNKIQDYYQDDDITVMIFTVFGELISNFYAHAKDETRSIIVGYGNKESIEVACADSGVGIVNSLKTQYHFSSDLKYLEYSIKQNVSSKPGTNHMGCGLWEIDRLIKKNGGRFLLYSGSSYYETSNGKTEFRCVPSWDGTIAYAKLNLHHKVKLSEILNDIKR